LHIIAQPKNALEDKPDKQLCAIARSANIGAFPLSASYQSGIKKQPSQQGLLIGFANMEDHLIDAALAQFAGALSS
ncbi:MAG: hypothetical protein AB3N28_02055, partial [Kordiimonas sp.]